MRDFGEWRGSWGWGGPSEFPALAPPVIMPKARCRYRSPKVRDYVLLLPTSSLLETGCVKGIVDTTYVDGFVEPEHDSINAIFVRKHHADVIKDNLPLFFIYSFSVATFYPFSI